MQTDQEHVAAVSFDEFRSMCALFSFRSDRDHTEARELTAIRDDRKCFLRRYRSIRPLFIICIAKEAGFVESLNPGSFIVNVLSQEQRRLAERFSNRWEEHRFLGVDWPSGWADVPPSPGTVASFGACLKRRPRPVTMWC